MYIKIGMQLEILMKLLLLLIYKLVKAVKSFGKEQVIKNLISQVLVFV